MWHYATHDNIDADKLIDNDGNDIGTVYIHNEYTGQDTPCDLSSEDREKFAQLLSVGMSKLNALKYEIGHQSDNNMPIFEVNEDFSEFVDTRTGKSYSMDMIKSVSKTREIPLDLGVEDSSEELEGPNV